MFSKKLIWVMLPAVLMLSLSVSARSPRRAHPPRNFYDGWRIGPQAYSFKKFTFFEAIDKAADLGCSWMEAYPGQKIRDGLDAGMGPDMSAELRAEVKKKLAESGIKLICYGVTSLPNNEAGARKVFKFAKDMGIGTITSEPSEDSFDLLDRLAQEYKINIAIHNHPKPSHYWNPDTVLKVCKGRSKYIGACADTGHWMRSNINPLEAVKKLKDRIHYFHFKDLNKFGSGAHDIPWGTGKAEAGKILEYLHQIGWKGYFSIEYEYNWNNSVPEIRQCIRWFEDTGAKLKPSGWKRLLADDLSNCTTNGNWEMKDDVLARVENGGDIWTKEQYGNFLLDLEFKVGKKTNSGVFIRTADIVKWLNTGIEVQIHDSNGGDINKHICGAIFDCLAPRVNTVKPAGQWNHMTIICRDNVVVVMMNGQLLLKMDLDEWTGAGQNPAKEAAPNTHPSPDGSGNKFTTAYKDMARSGHIGFQDHGHQVWYRNIKIREF